MNTNSSPADSLLHKLAAALHVLINHNTPEWLRTSQAQAYLSCSRSVINKLRESKILPYYNLGGMVYFNREEIDRIIEDSKVDRSNAIAD
ncbi:helix-turn-helix domain-containing protein [bacterium]|nr:helix-turn-helix domain-containing protein [bacterium]